MFLPTIIILAAGDSSRLGKAKQLLVYKNKSLLKHAIDEAEKIKAQIIVVLGANETTIKKELTDTKIEVVYNNNWEQGMGTSINAGLKKALENNAELNSCIICVCDQPYVSADLFKQLIDKQIATGKKIIASSYAGTHGTPVLFGKDYFTALLALHGDEGAKKIVKHSAEDVAAVEFEMGKIDIDSQADYDQLLAFQ